MTSNEVDSTRTTLPPRVIHVSPHPDDEAVGCPATLLALRDQGFSVSNIVTSLGSPADRVRRRDEVLAAAAIGRFDVEILDDVIARDPLEYEAGVTDAVVSLASRSDGSKSDGPVILVSPSPHDKHPRHEAVGRAIATAGEILGGSATWWMYSVWGALPLPTASFMFDDTMLRRADALLSAYAGEVARNDYRRLVHGRSMAAAILGAEQIFGFGSTNDFVEPYAELFTEAEYHESKWLAGKPRRIDVTAPLARISTRDISTWVRQPSASALVGWS